MGQHEWNKSRNGQEEGWGAETMIDEITQTDIEQIARKPGTPAVSMYMPTQRAGRREVRQNPTRFKNLLARSEKMLAETDASDHDLLAPARVLLQDDRFWSNQEEGLAVFLSAGQFRFFRLPVPFKELVVVSDHFHTKPLLAFLGTDQRFLVLALSQKQPRLLECSRQNCQEVTPEAMPKGISETLRYDDPERQLQYHTGTSWSRQKRSAVFHGQGVGIDESKDNIRRYVHDIDKAVQPFLGEKDTPMVLVGLDYILSLYREASKSRHLITTDIVLNPDDLKDEELHVRAFEASEAYFRNALETELERYHNLRGTGLTSAEIGEIVYGAFFGRVDALFLIQGVQCWGHFDEEKGKAVLHNKQMPGDRDLLDFAALHAVAKGGRVYMLAPERMPEKDVCAIFRF